MGLTPHPHLECRGPRKSRAIPLLTLRAFAAYKKSENLPTFDTAIFLSVLYSDMFRPSLLIGRHQVKQSILCIFSSMSYIAYVYYDDKIEKEMLQHVALSST